jgi:hypothetical protein
MDTADVCRSTSHILRSRRAEQNPSFEVREWDSVSIRERATFTHRNAAPSVSRMEHATVRARAVEIEIAP